LSEDERAYDQNSEVDRRRGSALTHLYTIQIPTDRLHENAARVRTLHVMDATKLLFFNLCRQFSGSAKRGAGTGLINTSPAGRTKLAGR